MLTKRQKQVLNYVKKYIKKMDYAPSLEEIKKYFKFASVSTAHHHIQALKNTGYLHKESNQPRALDVFSEQRLVQIPILGIIAAGQPIEAVENRESIAVPQSKVKNNNDYFALKVAGESMRDDNIHNGDIVIIKNQPTAENGQKVVALINNSEVTLKKLYKEKNGIRLEPANPKFKAIIVPYKNIRIQGVVIDVIRNSPNNFEPIKKINTLLNDTKSSQAANTDSASKRIKKIDGLINKIICCDAVLELGKIPDNACDVIIVDPPYNIGKDFGNNIDKRDLREYIAWSKNWINECMRIMKPNATMFIYGFSEILAYLSVEIPLNIRWLIWHYTNKNVASLHFWQRSHEALICCWKSNPVFNRDAVREPYTEGFLNGAAGKIRKGTPGRFSRNGKETIYNAHKEGALPRDVIKIPALAGGAGMTERWFLCKTCDDVFAPKNLKNHEGHQIIKHPTQKPIELSCRLIKSAMPKDKGIILVPFAGVGSECVAAKKLGMNYIGLELNPDYIRIADKRLTRAELQNTCF